MAGEASSAEALTEEERRALRGSKFAPLPAPPPPVARWQPRMAHPGGPVTTNKAAALAKFLERKLQQPDGLSSLNPKLVELAVKNAKDAVNASRGASSASGSKIKHVASFDDSQDSGDDEDKAQIPKTEDKKHKKRKKKKNSTADKKKRKKVKS